MTDRRTPFEIELLDRIEDMQAILEGPHDGRRWALDYMALMGHLRDIRVYLENKRFGCPTGKHSGRCRHEE